MRRSTAAVGSGRGGQRSVFSVGSGCGWGPNPVVVDGRLAGARTPAVLGAGAGARRDTARRGTDRAGSGVRAIRRGGLRDAGVVWVAVAAFVRFYEEPTLTRRFGAEYEAYRRAVPAWWPRLRPWEPGKRDGPGAG